MKRVIAGVLLSLILAIPLQAGNDTKPTVGVMVLQLLSQYNNKTTTEALAAADHEIERVWRILEKSPPINASVQADFALLRARSATAKKDRSRIVSAWDKAFQAKVFSLTSKQLLSMNVEAASAAAIAKDYAAVSRFFAAARAYVMDEGDKADTVRLNLHLQELRLIAPTMQWRALKDALSDVRQFASFASAWSLPKLNLLVSESELRLAYQPETKEKREDLAALKAEIDLIIKGTQANGQSPMKGRVRSLFYALEDIYSL